jgi:hypothetical protein
VALKKLLWAAASSYIDIEFRHHMEEIKKLNPAAFEYLEKIDPSGWSSATFLSTTSLSVSTHISLRLVTSRF